MLWLMRVTGKKSKGSILPSTSRLGLVCSYTTSTYLCAHCKQICWSSYFSVSLLFSPMAQVLLERSSAVPDRDEQVHGMNGYKIMDTSLCKLGRTLVTYSPLTFQGRRLQSSGANSDQALRWRMAARPSLSCLLSLTLRLVE